MARETQVILLYIFDCNKCLPIKRSDFLNILYLFSFFFFDPVNGDFNVGGVNFQWTDGIYANFVFKYSRNFRILEGD